MNQLKITIKKQYELSLLENVTCVDKKDHFIDDVLNHEDLDYYNLIVDEKEPISFSKIYQLDIKINDVGKISFFFNKEEFNKDALINQIQTLKEFQITDLNSKIIKVQKLLEIIKTEKVLFGIFTSDEIDTLNSENFSNSPFKIIFVNPNKKKLEKANKKQTKIGKHFSSIFKEKLYFIFLLLASLIISFATLLGVYNCYPNNAVYIFFFICTAAASVLNFFIYRDMFKKYNVISSMFFTGIAVDLIGLGAGLGIFVAYFNGLKNIPEVIPSLSTLLLIGFLISLLLVAITILIEILIKKLIKKK